MDIEIFPHRLLNAETTEKLLNELEVMEGVKMMVVHGPRLPPVKEGSSDRTITIQGEKVQLQVQTGRILLEIDEEDTISDVRAICENHLPFGFNVYVGTFIRKEKTVTDDIKYAGLDQIPEEMIGLTDQNAKLSERTTVIKRKD